ncbi:putative transposase [Glutamicibacter uratoxydans]|uniref:putative transposase n=1 Tax=Glutamicibacter uratoxydans TaxID=43667 RepID=UPI003D6F607F
MSTQPPLAIAPTGSGTLIGAAAQLIEDTDGGQVFIYGQLTHVWEAADQESRRFAAVNLLNLHAARAGIIASAFGVSVGTLWRWKALVAVQGVAGLLVEKRGPQGNSKLSPALIVRIHELKAAGLSNRAAAEQAGVSEFSVRRAMSLDPVTGQAPVSPAPTASQPATGKEAEAGVGVGVLPAQEPLPLLADPEPRTTHRMEASIGGLGEATPVFTPAARVPYAGLLLALPALEATGLRGCIHQVYGSLKPGFYGLDTMILETVLRTLAGEHRAEGAARLDPVGFGRILGMDRAPQVRTVRRKHQELASQGLAGALLEALGRHHLAGLVNTLNTSQDTDTRQARQDSGTEPGGSTAPTKDASGGSEDLGLVVYVDGHVRSYQGKKKTGKQYSTRLKFPTPATMETWVADGNGAPIFMVMAEPNSSLVSELRRLTPTLREMIGDQRRVLIGFDREGWSPQLFEHLIEAGLDPLTWRKGEIEPVNQDLFAECEYTDRWGVTTTYGQVADTRVNLTYGSVKNPTLVPMRQISRIVAAGKHTQEATGDDTRQIHLLTSNTQAPAAELLHVMSRRWRHENYFRFAREHFALDAHDTYQAVADDARRSVPNPAKEQAKRKRDVLAAQLNGLVGVVQAQEVALSTPQPGETLLVTNKMLNDVNAPVIKLEKQLAKANAAYQKIPARLPLGEVSPGQVVLDTELKQLLHAFRMAAYNISMILATEVRTQTGYSAAQNETHNFIRQALSVTGDIDPRREGFLEVVLDPMGTGRDTRALARLCERLTETGTVFPGTDRVLRYRVKGL